MIVAGMKIIMSRMLDSRKILVVGISMIFGIGAPLLYGSFQHTQPWIKPLLGSSLSVATMAALFLNALLRIGIARRALIELSPESNISEKAADFLLERGAVWGARREIVRRATMALGELVDNILATGLSGGGISVSSEFDEFNLDIFVRYQGQPLFFTGERPDLKELLEDDRAFLKLSSFLVRQYTDRIQVKNDGEQCRVHLHFDH
jgi:NCS2 family nucleobase:cation symporter-2